ncbi:hypothetical protein [Geosporobacter ferrireducens]|uniref:hypothetical protein n=1 Tax=Geosporobacter ferrireducens TaxID=1424294 RepID=UPI0012EA3C05|nr:hypothetical protein [Geosporobacter ferrireducens]MTI54833.1 hypothetical protein [Geosporobacter ferrireducens]
MAYHRTPHAYYTASSVPGMHAVALVVFDKNEIGNGFWESVGFLRRDDLVYRNRIINDRNL